MIHTTDQDLLLLVHNELTIWRKIAAQGHCALCPRCQTRLEKLVGASRLLADAVRSGDLPRWSLPTPQATVATARIASAWRLTALLVIGLATVQITSLILHSSHKPATQSGPLTSPSDGCRPDLHNDQCR